MTTFKEFVSNLGMTATADYMGVGDRGFKWNLTLFQGPTSAFYDTEYHMGLAHCVRARSAIYPREAKERITLDIASALKPFNRPTLSDLEGFVFPTVPDTAMVLESLQCDCQCGDVAFEEFCSEFGYDTDSRKAYALWQKCVNTRLAVKAWLGAHYEAFMTLQCEK